MQEFQVEKGEIQEDHTIFALCIQGRETNAGSAHTHRDFTKLCLFIDGLGKNQQFLMGKPPPQEIGFRIGEEGEVLMGFSSKQGFPAVVSDPRTCWRQDLSLDRDQRQYPSRAVYTHTHLCSMSYPHPQPLWVPVISRDGGDTTQLHSCCRNSRQDHGKQN